MNEYRRPMRRSARRFRAAVRLGCGRVFPMFPHTPATAGTPMLYAQRGGIPACGTVPPTCRFAWRIGNHAPLPLEEDRCTGIMCEGVIFGVAERPMTFRPMRRAPENKPLRMAAEILALKPFNCPWGQLDWAGCSNQNRWCSIDQQADCWYQYCMEEGSA